MGSFITSCSVQRKGLAGLVMEGSARAGRIRAQWRVVREGKAVRQVASLVSPSASQPLHKWKAVRGGSENLSLAQLNILLQSILFVIRVTLKPG